jgi:LysR family transcriptional regulator (chromosome initiation inhibitor)
MQLDQLRALRASVDAGTLDGAARLLGLTPSAVSQRLRALETATGRVLLVRSRPVRVTPSGEAVLRLARQVEALVADTAAELGGGAVPVVPSPSTPTRWPPGSSRPSPRWPGRSRSTCTGPTSRARPTCCATARVMAAVTVDATPVAGCRVTRWACCATACSPRPRSRSAGSRGAGGSGPRSSCSTAPTTCRTPTCAAAGSTPAAPPRHHVPSSADFVDAVRLGMGWGMVPDVQRPPGWWTSTPAAPRRHPALAAVAAALGGAGPGGRGVLAAGRAALERPAAERSAGGRGSAVASRPSDEAAEAGSRRLEP